MMMSPMIKTGRIGTEVLVGVLAGLSVVVCVWQAVEARDLFAPKEQVTTEEIGRASCRERVYSSV